MEPKAVARWIGTICGLALGVGLLIVIVLIFLVLIQALGDQL